MHDTDFEFEMCRAQVVSVGVPNQISLLRMRYCTAKRPKPNFPALVSNGAAAPNFDVAVGPHVPEGVFTGNNAAPKRKIAAILP